MSSYGPGGARAGNSATDVLVGAVLMFAVLVPPAAKTAYAKFHESGDCFTDSWTGETTVSPGSKHDYTVTIKPEAGGVMAAKGTLHATAGTVSPTHLTVHARTAESFSYEAPAGFTGKTVYVGLDAVSKRGVVRASLEVHVSAPTVKLTYSATVSGSDSCTDSLATCAPAYYGGSGGTASESHVVAGSLAGTASTSLTSAADGASGAPVQSTLHETATSDSYSWSVTNGFGGYGNIGPCPNADGPIDAHGGFELTSAFSGPLRILSLALAGKKDTNGTLDSVSAVNLSYSLATADGVTAGENVLSEMETTAPANCVGQSSDAWTEQDVVGGVFWTQGTVMTSPPERGITMPSTRWKINKSWTAQKGGTIATATVTLTDSGSQDASTWNYTTTERFTLTTPAGQARPRHSADSVAGEA